MIKKIGLHLNAREFFRFTIFEPKIKVKVDCFGQKIKDLYCHR